MWQVIEFAKRGYDMYGYAVADKTEHVEAWRNNGWLAEFGDIVRVSQHDSKDQATQEAFRVSGNTFTLVTGETEQDWETEIEYAS